MSNGGRRKRGLKQQLKRRKARKTAETSKVVVVGTADSPYQQVLEKGSGQRLGKLLAPSEQLAPSEHLYPGDEWKAEWV